MRDLQAFELEHVSGGQRGEITMEAGVSKDKGGFVMIRGTIRFGGDESSGTERKRAATQDGDEPAFTATAKRP